MKIWDNWPLSPRITRILLSITCIFILFIDIQYFIHKIMNNDIQTVKWRISLKQYCRHIRSWAPSSVRDCRCEAGYGWSTPGLGPATSLLTATSDRRHRCLLTWQITRWQTRQIGNNYKITTHNSIYKLVKHKVKHTLSEHQLFKLQPQIIHILFDYLIDKSNSKVARYLNPPNFQFPLVSDVMVLLRIYSRWKFLFEPA